MSTSLLKMNSNSPSNAETERITTTDQNHHTSQLSCDANPAFLVFNWVSFSFLCCYSFTFSLTTILSTNKADLLGALKRLVVRSFWFTVNNQTKGHFFLNFQFTCILTEWMRFRTLLFCFASRQRSWTYRSTEKHLALFFHLKFPFSLKSNCGGKKNKINKIRPAFERRIFCVLESHFTVHEVGSFWGGRVTAAQKVAWVSCAESIGSFH